MSLVESQLAIGFLNGLYSANGECWSELDALRLCRCRLADLLRQVYSGPLLWPHRASLTEAIDSHVFGLEAPEQFRELFARVLPVAHAELGWNRTAPQHHLSRAEALRVLVAGYRALRPRLAELRTGPVPNWVRRDGPDWLRQTRGDPGHWAVERLVRQLEPHLGRSFSTLLIHGSVASREVIPGMSDLDTLVLLSNDAFAGEAELDRALRILSASHACLLAFNPYMHHSHLLATEMDLQAISISTTPPCLFRIGASWGDWNSAAGLSDSDLDCLMAFRMFDWFYEEWLQHRTALRDAYEVIWWASSLVFLPVLYVQLRDGVDRWKPDAIAEARPHLSAEEIDLLDYVTDLRARCREIPLLPESWWKGFPDDAHPALAAQHARALTSDINWSAFGVTSDRLAQSTAFFRNIRQRAYGHWRERNAAKPRMARSSWLTLPVPIALTEQPRVTAMTEYQAVKEEFLARATSIPGVAAVFQFGEVACPGLSDLDFVVVVDDHCADSEELLGGLLDGPSAVIMGHGPVVLGVEAFRLFPSVYPVFGLQRLYGEIDPPPPTPMHADALVPLTICMLLAKYPSDLIYLRTQPQVRLKTLAAFVHSHVHFARTLKAIGGELPLSIHQLIALDQRTRSVWSSGGGFDWRQMIDGLDLMLRASADLLDWIDKYFRGHSQPDAARPVPERLTAAGLTVKFSSEWSRELLLESIEEASCPGSSQLLVFPESIGNYLVWMCGGSGPASDRLARQLRPLPELRSNPALDRYAAYRHNLNQFVAAEDAQGRRIIKYILLT